MNKKWEVCQEDEDKVIELANKSHLSMLLEDSVANHAW